MQKSRGPLNPFPDFILRNAVQLEPKSNIIKNDWMISSPALQGFPTLSPVFAGKFRPKLLL
jgi:hypothetical protein